MNVGNRYSRSIVEYLECSPAAETHNQHTIEPCLISAPTKPLLQARLKVLISWTKWD